MVKRLYAFISTIVVALSVMSAATDTSTRIFNPAFRTLKTGVEDNFMSPPVIRLGTNDRIVISFDEIGEDNSYLEYRVIHCNADWQPSRLIESEYVSGFNSQRIEDYAFSSATFVHYVNYMIMLPNDDMQFTHSGNFLLQVYDPEDPDRTILQTRFQISENIASISADVSSRTDMGHNTTWQQMGLNVNTEGLGPINIYQDILVEVMQNDREATRRTLQSPLRVSGANAVYEHMNGLIFPASNEYRRFESVSNSFPGMHVDSLRYMGSNYHVWLKPDEPRAAREYQFDRTQHGRFLVHEYNATDSDIGADYITVNFRLETDEMPGDEIYVDGEFTHGLYDSTNKMEYDSATGAYVASIPVKQGAYNYQYVSRPKGSKSLPTPQKIEGDKYETGNEYSVAVFFRPPGARADRLAGYRIFNYN